MLLESPEDNQHLLNGQGHELAALDHDWDGRDVASASPGHSARWSWIAATCQPLLGKEPEVRPSTLPRGNT